MTNPMQAGANDPVTPRDTPSSPGGYSSVTPHGQGPAPYDIQAPAGDLSGAFAGAGNLSAGRENDIYGVGPRQRQTETLLTSDAGFALGGYDIDAGWTGNWPGNVEPGG